MSHTVAARLKPFLRPELDVLFVALNPPVQSNRNGHYFSGGSSRFFKLLHLSGLITQSIDKAAADDTVFGNNTINHNHASFGVIDLVCDHVETNSGKVRVTRSHSDKLVEKIRHYEPRFICVIHSKVQTALNRHPEFLRPLCYGVCGHVLRDCNSSFVVNYFPNGNAVKDEPKLAIFGALRALI